MESNANRKHLLSAYFLTPIIISIMYVFETTTPESLASLNIIDRIDNITGIFSYIWMCFNIVMITKSSMIEENFSLKGLIKFHTYMSVIALFFAFLHGGLFILQSIQDDQLISGTIGFLLFAIFMFMAIIFMSNRWLKIYQIKRMRLLAYDKKFKYDVNKILHNITMVAVFIVFIHTLLSFTSKSSFLIRAMYFGLFDITFIGWITHKIVRQFREKKDPYLSRKVQWDVPLSEITRDPNHHWSSELLAENSTFFPCFQCGTCTSVCPVSDITKGEYNPREIIQYVLLGQKDSILVDKIPNVWDCTCCCSCEEACPQHIQIVDILTAIKNEFAEKNEAPSGFIGEAVSVYNMGISVPQQGPIIRRREKLGLPPTPEYDLQEVQDMMEMAGLKKLVEISQEEETKVKETKVEEKKEEINDGAN